jgi:ribosome biogenesis GTPase
MSDMSLQDLIRWGWDSIFQLHFQELNISGSVPSRVISESRDSFQVFSPHGELSVKITGRMRYQCESENQYPAVGDWVVVSPLIAERKGTIQAILPRKSKFSRKVAGELIEEQVVAANIDTIFIVSGLDGGRNFNLRRIERYLMLASHSGAEPVVVLNKSDVCQDIDACIRQVEAIAPCISVYAVSARAGAGLEVLKNYMAEGKTVAFLGSSGVGKSSIINALLGVERQDTGRVRENDHVGRHTTTRRELILLPGGGMVIDSPGMRELQMWGSEGDLNSAFSDIEALVKKCHFKNCSHNGEPDCAVQAAIDSGDLNPARLESYQKLRNELAYLASREEDSTRLHEKEKWKKISKWSKEIRNSP